MHFVLPVAIEVLIGVVSSAATIIGILIFVIVALSVVVIKGRKPHRYTSQGTFSSNQANLMLLLVNHEQMVSCTFLSLIIAIDRDIETKPNEVCGLVSGQTNEHHDREFCEPLIIHVCAHS